MDKFKDILKLFLISLKIGLFTFGGGYGMLALIEHEFTEKRNYLSAEEFADMVAIAESTPGPIAINAATYTGYKRAGFFGALAATLGVCIPSFIIIFVISLFFNAFLSYKIVQYAFRGVQACVIFLILYTGVKTFIKLKKTPFGIAVMCVTFACMTLLGLFAVDFSSVFYILISGAAGLFVYLAGLVAARIKRGKK